MTKKTLTFDVETHSADLLYTLPPREFVRLIGYAWNNDPVVLTEDLDELLAAIRSADWVVGHNIHLFDLTAVFGKDSIEPLELTRDGKVFDTWTHSTLANPAPKSYTDRKGRNIFVRGPEHAKVWHSLDNQAFQLGVAGKSADLKALAKKYHVGPIEPIIVDGEIVNVKYEGLDYGAIPTTDREFRDYLIQDVTATRNVARKLLQLGPLDDYARREQLNAAIDAQNARNGWRVDQDAARARVAELDAIRDRYMTMLVNEYDFPTTGAAPLRSNAGKEAITRALASVDISLDDLPRTKKAGKDTDRPSFGGEGLIEAARDKSPAAQELTAAIAAIGGLRPLAQSALDNVHPDGRVHPTINTLQRSGRKSTQKPGLTIWSARGSGKVEKAYFVPNQDDHVLVAFDLSQADSRIVAALSGDTEFAKRFEEGVDAHLLTAWAIWGKDVVGTDKNDPVTAGYRNTSKGCSHADAFRAGPRTIARTAGVPLAVATQFSDTMKRLYPKRLAWQDKVTKEGRRGFVTNDWGRRMVVERDREFTQSPALYGQSGTREIIVDGLIRMLMKDIRVITFLVAQIHDELVFSVPESEAEHWADLIQSCMETTWQPSDGSGQAIHFPAGRTPFVKNWADCEH